MSIDTTSSSVGLGTITSAAIAPLTTDLTTSIGNSSLLTDSFLYLSLTGSASAFSQSTAAVINSFDEIQGTLTFNNGLLTSDLTTPFGPLQQTFNLTELATSAVNSFNQISGLLNLSNGTATGNLDLGDEEFTGNFEFAQTIGSFVSSFLKDLKGTVPFANGELQLDLPTPFGAVTGTLGFGSGRLVNDLNTPFGPLDFSLDYPPNTSFDFSINGIPASLNLNQGAIQIDLNPAVPGPEASIPLNALSGNFTFDQGIVIANLTTPFGNFSTPFDLAGEAGESITQFLTGVTGTLGIGNGSLTADLTTSQGSFQGSLNVSEIVNSLIPTLPQYNGTLTLSAGTIAANLSTPYGPLIGNFNYGQYLDEIAAIAA
jgi:hypothetical protein